MTAFKFFRFFYLTFFSLLILSTPLRAEERAGENVLEESERKAATMANWWKHKLSQYDVEEEDAPQVTVTFEPEKTE